MLALIFVCRLLYLRYVTANVLHENNMKDSTRHRLSSEIPYTGMQFMRDAHETTSKVQQSSRTQNPFSFSPFFVCGGHVVKIEIIQARSNVRNGNQVK